MTGPSGVVVVTDRRQATAPLPEVVAAAVAGGARWVLLREKDLPRPERAALAEALRAVLAPAGGRLIVAGPDPLGGDAIHLSAADPASRGCGLVGRSCHSAAELDRLTSEDYVTLSPVYASASKPGYGPPMGPESLGTLCRRTDRPVLALGGIETPAQATACLAAGAAGVAVMGAVMRAADPASVVAELCAVFVAMATTTAHSSALGRAA
jgi:thiamine-phosphate pyrophosphorylase